jgi:hypothetical protein
VGTKNFSQKSLTLAAIGRWGDKRLDFLAKFPQFEWKRQEIGLF